MLSKRSLTTLLACSVILLVAAGAKTAAGPATAAETPAKTAVRNPIKHIVVLDLENHSFDSLLGYWCDNHPGRCPRGGMPSSVKLSDGTVVKPAADPDVVPLVAHDVASQLAAMNIKSGVPQMNGWQNTANGECSANSGYACISGYLPRQEPNLSALANKFAISDATFSLADSPSWGGHLYIVLSNLDGFTGDIPVKPLGAPGAGWGCDSNSTTTWSATLGGPPRNVPSCVPDPSLTFSGAPVAHGGAFERTPVPYEPTIMDELKAAGLSWKFYGGSCKNEVTAPNGLQTCESGVAGYDWSPCASIAECLYKQSNHIAPLPRFVTNTAAGKLPAFSVITPSSGNVKDSEHNGFSITAGDNWIGRIASAVMHSPDWGSTVLFITWDDCGCFYDQARPGINPDGSQQGPRVPLVIVSPYARPGYTDSTSTTFAGILAYTEHTFGLAPLGPNDAKAYGFQHAFDYAQAPLRPVPMVHRPVPPGDHIRWAQARQDT